MKTKRNHFKKFFKLSVLSVLSVAIVFLFSCLAVAAQNRVVVRGETTIASDRVTLGEISEISGRDAERLKQIALGYAPQPGMIREIPKDKIKLAVAAAGFAAGDFTLESAPLARVRRASQAIDREVLRRAIENAVLPPGETSGGVEIKIVRLDLPENIEVPAGEVEVRASASAVRSFVAPFVVSLEIRLGGSVIRRVSANVQVEAFAEVLVAAKDLAANSRIDPAAHAVLEKRKLTKPLQNYLRAKESLRGMTAIKNVVAGEELTIDVFVPGVVIKAGDRVRIVGRSGKIQISVEGEARSSGRIGSRIMVKNLNSNAMLQAVVVDEGLVQINF